MSIWDRVYQAILNFVQIIIRYIRSKFPNPPSPTPGSLSKK